MSHSLSFSSAEIETACFLIKFAKDHDMSEKIAVYLDDEFSAVYPLDSFAEWKYVPPLDHAALSALAGRKVIEFKFDDWMGLYILSLRVEIFAVFTTICEEIKAFSSSFGTRWQGN